jgi:hypothetical protein
MPITESLGAAWRFDNDLADASGNGRTLVDQGNLVFTTSGVFRVQGTHALLSGFEQLASWGGPAATLADTSLTISTWATRPTTSSPGGNNVGWNSALILSFGFGHVNGVGVFIGGVSRRSGLSSDLTPDTKAHIALTWDHTTGGWQLWRNGVLLDSGTVGGQSATISGTSFEVQAGNSGANTNTPLDITLAYTRKLTPDEIVTLATPNTSDPAKLLHPRRMHRRPRSNQWR